MAVSGVWKINAFLQPCMLELPGSIEAVEENRRVITVMEVLAINASIFNSDIFLAAVQSCMVCTPTGAARHLSQPESQNLVSQ